MPVIVAPKHSKTSVLLFAGVMLIAVCLRAPVTNVGPLLEVIRENLHLSPIAVGILPTLPLFTFGAVSLLSGYTRYLGIERSLFAAMCLLTLGLIVRSLGSEATLFAGTIMLAAGIAIANVLLPSVIKRDFPKRITLMTTLYVTLMGTVAALSSGMAVPVAAFFAKPATQAAAREAVAHANWNWQASLGIWALLTFIATLVWLPQIKYKPSEDISPTSCPVRAKPVWKHLLAWEITVFMGLQSMCFFVLASWLPAILLTHNVPLKESGWLLGLYQVIGLVAGLILPLLVPRLKDQRLLGLSFSLLSLVGPAGLLFCPQQAAVWLVLSGTGSGGCFILALAFISLRTNDYAEATRLSSMVQSFGYLISGTGPFTFGLIHQLSQSWNLVLGLLCVLGLIQAWLGWRGGRNITIGGDALKECPPEPHLSGK